MPIKEKNLCETLLILYNFLVIMKRTRIERKKFIRVKEKRKKLRCHKSLNIMAPVRYTRQKKI